MKSKPNIAGGEQAKTLLERLWMPLSLFLSGLLLHFPFIAWPAQVVFDEVHFGKFVDGYFTHQYFFDIHPPLGKLLIALAGLIAGWPHNFDFNTIGESYGSLPYVALRFLPNLAGALIPIAFYWFMKEFGAKDRTAFFGAILLLFDNAILVQSRFILVDAFLLIFGVLGMAFFFRARNRDYKFYLLLLAGFFLALSFSVKWTGLGFFGSVVLIYLWDLLKNFIRRPPASISSRDVGRGQPGLRRLLLQGAVSFLIIPFVLYVSIFAIHFSLLTHSGPGDAFMTSSFQKTLIGSVYYDRQDVKPIGFWKKFTELNVEMYEANATLKATHPYSSNVYTWPFMVRPVYYWVKSYGPQVNARIYFLGNPLVWWGSTIGLILGLFFWRPRPTPRDGVEAGEARAGYKKFFLTAGYFSNLLPFLDVTRVTFLYHYLPALIFAAAFTSFGLFERSRDKYSMGARSMWILIGFVAAAFIFFVPLSYGFPLSDSQYGLRTWFRSWI